MHKQLDPAKKVFCLRQQQLSDFSDKTKKKTFMFFTAQVSKYLQAADVFDFKYEAKLPVSTTPAINLSLVATTPAIINSLLIANISANLH
jgi:hypothetical protein